MYGERNHKRSRHRVLKKTSMRALVQLVLTCERRTPCIVVADAIHRSFSVWVRLSEQAAECRDDGHKASSGLEYYGVDDQSRKIGNIRFTKHTASSTQYTISCLRKKELKAMKFAANPGEYLYLFKTMDRSIQLLVPRLHLYRMLQTIGVLAVPMIGDVDGTSFATRPPVLRLKPIA